MRHLSLTVNLSPGFSKWLLISNIYQKLLHLTKLEEYDSNENNAYFLFYILTTTV